MADPPASWTLPPPPDAAPDSRRIESLSIVELRAAFIAERAREDRARAELVAQAVAREERLLAHASEQLEALRAHSAAMLAAERKAA